MCSEKDNLFHLQMLQMGTIAFSEKETGTKGVAMVTVLQVSFFLFCDVHFWCQV